MRIFKALSITCSLLLSLPLSAQETQYKEKLDSIIYYIAKDRCKQKEIFYYDRHGRISQIALYRWGRGTDRWRLYSLTQCKYDAEGRNILWEQNLLSENTWETSHRMEAEYDEKGNMVKLINDSREYFIYERGADGRLESETFLYPKNGGWRESQIHRYTHDEAGNVTSYILSEKRGDKWVQVENMRYGYDANGNKTSESRYYMSHSKNCWVLADSTTYSYDADRRMTKRCRYSEDENGKWRASSERTYTYDVAGNQIEMQDFLLAPDRPFTRTVLEYDASVSTAQVCGLQTEPLLYWKLYTNYLDLTDDLCKYTAKIKSHRIIDLIETTAYDMTETATFYYSAY